MGVPRIKTLGSRPRRRYNRGPVDSKALLMRLAGKPVRRLGIELMHRPGVNGAAGTWALPGGSVIFNRQHDAIRAWLDANPRQFGPYKLIHDSAGWLLQGPRIRPGAAYDEGSVYRWLSRPTRKEVADQIRRARNWDSRPSHVKPDTLGWRTWVWNPRERCLMSPQQKVLWPGHDLVIKEPWNEADVVRGKSGIHACRLPKGDWKQALAPGDMPKGTILGLVERFGKFVLGAEGWRAEWVVIKELVAPDEAVARLLRATYPEVAIHIAHDRHWIREVLL